MVGFFLFSSLEMENLDGLIRRWSSCYRRSYYGVVNGRQNASGSSYDPVIEWKKTPHVDDDDRLADSRSPDDNFRSSFDTIPLLFFKKNVFVVCLLLDYLSIANPLNQLMKIKRSVKALRSFFL